MARIRVRFVINRGRHGAPLTKLGKISEQTDKFLRALSKDCQIETHPGEWLAANFKNGSVEYDAEFQGDVNPGAAQMFSRNLELLIDFDPEREGLNIELSDSTMLEYARIGSLIDPDEAIDVGIYPVRGGNPKWRQISYNTTSSLRRQIEAPLPSYGSLQGVMHSWFMQAREPHFQMRELSTDSLVSVFYPIELYKEVAQAVQERTTIMVVNGNLLFDRSTRAPTELKADKIELVEMLSGSEFEEFFGSAPNFDWDDPGEQPPFDG